MYIDYDFTEYPYFGSFYRGEVNEDVQLDEQEDNIKMVFETACDIMESSHNGYSNFIQSSFTIFFPLNKELDTILVKNGDIFKGSMNGMQINGKVVGVFPSNLRGCVVYIQDNDI